MENQTQPTFLDWRYLTWSCLFLPPMMLPNLLSIPHTLCLNFRFTASSGLFFWITFFLMTFQLQSLVFKLKSLRIEQQVFLDHWHHGWKGAVHGRWWNKSLELLCSVHLCTPATNPLTPGCVKVGEWSTVTQFVHSRTTSETWNLSWYLSAALRDYCKHGSAIVWLRC